MSTTASSSVSYERSPPAGARRGATAQRLSFPIRLQARALSSLSVAISKRTGSVRPVRKLYAERSIRRTS